jgi:hypothetical protein
MVKKCKDCDCKERLEFYKSFEEGTPYIEEIVNGRLQRTFSKDVPDHYLKWHQDEEDRVVIPVNENDWSFQFDHDLPIPLNERIYIAQGVYHRIIKGTTDLIVEILK